MRPLLPINVAMCALLLLVAVPLSSGLQNTNLGISSYGSIQYSLTWLHIDGRYIKDSTGRTIRLTGAGISVLEWGWGDPNRYLSGHWNEELIRFFKQVGGNSLRLALCCMPFDDSYFALVDEFVAWCKRNNVYCLLDMHRGDPDALDWSSDKLTIMENPTTPLNQLLGEKYPNVSWVDWLKFYAERYKNEPTVPMINLFNEPCEKQTDVDYMFSVWRNAASIAIDAVHSVNPNILCGVWGMYWGTTLRYFNENPLPQKNIVYCVSRHMAFDFGYNDYPESYVSGDYSSGKQKFISMLEREKILEMASKYPVDLMEWSSTQYGYYPEREAGYKQWMNDCLEILANYGINQHYWCFSGTDIHDGDLLKHQDWINGLLTLSERGEIWKRYLVTS